MKNWLLLLVYVSYFTAECQTGDESRPNIIFLLSDDQRDGTFGAMGHPVIKSPHTDKLIEESVRFTNTYIAEQEREVYKKSHVVRIR